MNPINPAGLPRQMPALPAGRNHSLNTGAGGQALCPLSRERGLALVMVLWLLILLTVIAASHARVVRTETRLASNHLEAGKARSLAEAGAHHAIMELLVRDQSQRWPVNGSVNRIRFDDGVVAIAIRDARGLIDINSARPALLDKLLAGTGLQQEPRQALVDAILDWRDQDNLKHLNGAEDDDYRRAGLRWAARDGAFRSVEELRYVMGMSNQVFERLAPYLTIYSGQAGVELGFAPPWLLSVLSDSEDIPDTGQKAAAGGSTYHITVWSTSSGGSNASLDLVVRIKASADEAYSILSWRAPARSINRFSG